VILGSFLILNVSPSTVPPENPPVLVFERVYSDQKPAVLSVFSPDTGLSLKGDSLLERPLPQFPESLPIVGMKNWDTVFANLLQSTPCVFEILAVWKHPASKKVRIRFKKENVCGDGIEDLAKLSFALA
jgi:hypothetical protein